MRIRVSSHNLIADKSSADSAAVFRFESLVSELREDVARRDAIIDDVRGEKATADRGNLMRYLISDLSR